MKKILKVPPDGLKISHALQVWFDLFTENNRSLVWYRPVHGTLPEYMVPACFVPLDVFPINNSMKVRLD